MAETHDPTWQYTIGALVANNGNCTYKTSARHIPQRAYHAYTFM